MCHYASDFLECYAEKDSEIGSKLSEEKKKSGLIGVDYHHC